MSALSRNILFGMFKANLQQCLDIAQAGNHDMAIIHLREAITQLEQLRDDSSEEPPALEQPTLDV